MALEDALPTLFILAIAMLCLAWLSRQLSVRTQLVVYFATGSLDLATLAIFLLLLPGVFVHELSHWVAARLLGLRTSKFRVWPKRHKDRIGLGSVSVERGGTWRDSAVGMAPLITGSILLALVGAAVFQSDLLVEQLAQGRLLDTVGAFFDALAKPDGARLGLFPVCDRQQHDAQPQRPPAAAAAADLCRPGSADLHRGRPADRSRHGAAGLADPGDPAAGGGTALCYYYWTCLSSPDCFCWKRSWRG